MRVGLTGGISTGKSTVARMFADLGCHLLDADLIVRELFRPGETVNRAVVILFGDRVLAADGSINRSVLGEIVFNDPLARQLLNSLVHPEVIKREKQWQEELHRQDPNAIGIVESALMIEAGTYTNYDKVILVTCPPEVQRRRLRERSGLADDQIQARIASQMPMEEKARFADYIIDNSGSLDETRTQVSNVYARLTG